MIYREIQPDPFWRPYVAAYWFAEGKSTATSRIYPDGFVDLIFHRMGSESIRVSGMMTSYREVVLEGEVELLGIRLKPEGLSLLQGLPMADIKNLSLPLSEVSTWPVDEWNDKFWSFASMNSKLRWIEGDLLPKLLHRRKKQDLLITSVCHDLSTQYVGIDIASLARHYYLSLRQLERRFKDVVGVSMKEYHRILRFTNALLDIQEKPQSSLLQIAYDHGYSDHAHLTREVLRMTGKNPSQLRLIS